MNLQTITENLLSRSTSPKLSMIIPMHPKSRSDSLEQDRIRLKNALTQVRDQVSTHDQEMQTTLNRLESQFEDVEFLKNQSKTLAVYADREDITFVKLDHEFSEFCHYGDEFIVTPLLVSNSIGSGMYILHISVNNPALYFYDNDTLERIEEVSLPESLADALNIDEYVKEQQHRAVRGSGNTMYHGHGGADNQQVDVEVYMTRLAHELNEYFTGKDIPVLLVGVKERIASIRHHLSYPHVLDEELHGNYQHLNSTELKQELSKLFSDFIHEDVHKREEVVQSLQDDIKVSDPDGISKASKYGQIKDLYVSILRNTKDSVRPGYATEFTFDMSKLDLSVIENLVRKVVSQGGKIHAVTKEGLGSVQQMAVLRYTTPANQAS